MRYVMFVVVDPTAPHDPTPDNIEEWVAEHDGSGARVTGHQLRGTSAATSVRVRNGETLVTDGPFTESKEWIAGFDILEVADLDEAIAIASQHPMARGGMIELRPYHQNEFTPEADRPDRDRDRDRDRD